MSPSDFSRASASRTTARLTEYVSVSCFSVGRRSPGASTPWRICSASVSAKPAESELLGALRGGSWSGFVDMENRELVMAASCTLSDIDAAVDLHDFPGHEARQR